MVRYWAHYTPSKPRPCDGCGDPLPEQMRRVQGTALCIDCAGESLAPWRRA